MVESKPRILLLAQEPELAQPFKRVLDQSGFEAVVQYPDSVNSRVARLHEFHMLISIGTNNLGQLHATACPVDALFVLGNSSDSKTVKIFQNSRYHFNGKNHDAERFIQTIKELLNGEPPVGPSARKRVGKWQVKKIGLKAIIGNSPYIVQLRRQIQRISQKPDSPVLITGETGTGKELVADALHVLSARVGKPFIKINCSAIPESLFESELFGHKRGAFTGAMNDQVGLLEKADGGVILLDEIGEMNLRLQPKLLRFLEDQTFHRVGDGRKISVDVWILAATNASLPDLVRKAKFRKDLYYRIKGLQIQLPPLRDRKEDIPLLFREFIRRESSGKPVDISQVEDYLCAYDWPGNVRELKNLAKTIFLNSDSNAITPKHLPAELQKKTKQDTSISSKSLANMEREYILRVFRENGKQIRTAARVLGINRNTLKKKLEKYHISKE